MQLGLTAEQMVKITNHIWESHHEIFDKAVTKATERGENDIVKLSNGLIAVSKIVVPTAIFTVIEENNKLISAQIEELLKQK